MKVPFDNLTLPNSRIYLCSINNKKKKKERETKTKLIGSLSCIKWIASFSVEPSSCFLAFSGMGQDKIPPPHQVRNAVQAPSGLCACPSLKLEQSSTRPSLHLSTWYSRHQDKWRGQHQTLDHNMYPCQLPFLSFLALPCSKTVPAFQNCWEKR